MDFSHGNNKPEKKKLSKAVAVQYELGMAAPSVVAKGVGAVADKIVEKAVESGVELYKNAELVEELSKVDLGDNIPPELYEVVAQILIFVSDLDKMQSYRSGYEKKQQI